VVVVLCACVVLVALGSPVDFDIASTTSFLQTGQSVGGGLNISALTLNGNGRESRIAIGNGDAFAIALKETGNFEIQHQGRPAFVVTNEGNVEIYGKVKTKGTVRIDNKMTFMGVNQWLLAAYDDFSATGSEGWSNTTTTSCGNENKKLLGGFGAFAGGEVHKSYHNLPPHSQIRLKANYHFIDGWTGETAYAKIDHKVMWTDLHDHMTSKAGIQVCGGPVPEDKFTVPVDVVMPHDCTEEGVCSLQVAFGSTLSASATEASWGLSDVQIYVR